MKAFKIYVTNNSGAKAKYFVTTEPPRSAGIPGGAIDQIHVVAKTTSVPTGGTAQFVLGRVTMAFCGNASSGSEEDSQVSVISSRRFEVATKTSPGSTFQVTNEDGTLSFGDAQASQTIIEGSFTIRNDSSFTVDEAKQNNFFVGTGGLTSGIPTPWSTFMVEPNMTYNIQAQKQVFWLSKGVPGTGSIPNKNVAETESIVVDFEKLSSPAIIIHDEQGHLVLGDREAL